MKLTTTGGSMRKKNMFQNISSQFIHFVDSFWNLVQKIPKEVTYRQVKTKKVVQKKPWERKKSRPSHTPKDEIHNEWPLGAERTETKIFNKLRR